MLDENRIYHKASRLGQLSRRVIEQSKYPRLSRFHLFRHDLVSLLKDSDQTCNQITEVTGHRTTAVTTMYEHQSPASRMTLSRNAPDGPEFTHHVAEPKALSDQDDESWLSFPGSGVESSITPTLPTILKPIPPTNLPGK